MSFSIPLHGAVFSLLYFGGLYLLESEIVAAHARDTRLLLAAAVSDIHLTMVDPSEDVDVRRRLSDFAAGHLEMGLVLWSADGERIAGEVRDPAFAAEERREVEALLADPEREAHVGLVDHRGATLVRSLVEIRAGERCVPCHEPGQLRGAASVSLDLTAELDALRGRVRFWVGLGVVSWVVLASVINRMIARAYRSSVARLRADLDDTGGYAVAQPAGAVALDPMSAALFESLRHASHDQREREKLFASRLHHADRLASLGELTAGLAHEIKNPLAGIQGALEILRDQASEDEADPETREVYQQMLDDLKRVDATIRTLLRFSRPASPRRARSDVPALLEDTVALLRRGLRRRGVTLEVETAPGLGSFPLDGEQIRQVLLNLVANAAEAITEADTRGGRIVVRGTAFPEGDGVVIAVEDDGPGISEENWKKVFQPFFSTKFTGTGLGLAVADSLVIQHGGRLELRSTPGEGTTFFVVLPAPEPAADTAESAAATPPTESESWPSS